MRSYPGIALRGALIGSLVLLAACDKKTAADNTNIVEMNASDGTMNDMTVVESATLDQAGGETAVDDRNTADNVSNGI